ncbi:thioesterase family protein [Dermatophilaceae bacterium Soc4.6]
MAHPPPASPTIPGYPYAARVPTRWTDDDVYGHVNNTVHYLAMDTVVNGWMIAHGLDVGRGPVIGLVVESGCRYVASLSYPDALVLGLRIARLGTTSVQWEIAMTRESDGEDVAAGRFVHVFVDRVTRRPAPVPVGLRAAMQALVVG